MLMLCLSLDQQLGLELLGVRGDPSGTRGVYARCKLCQGLWD